MELEENLMRKTFRRGGFYFIRVWCEITLLPLKKFTKFQRIMPPWSPLPPPVVPDTK